MDRIEAIIKQMAELRTVRHRYMMMQLSLEEFRQQAEEDTEALEDELITLAIWLALMKSSIKDLHIINALIGMGGVTAGDWSLIGVLPPEMGLTPGAWMIVGQSVQEQYKYLNGFVRDIVAYAEEEASKPIEEQKPFPKKFINRAKMYAGAGGSTFERVQAERPENKVATEYKWTMSPVENCPSCIEYSGRGWVPIGSLPGFPRDGWNTICMTNCKCRFTYR